MEKGEVSELNQSVVMEHAGESQDSPSVERAFQSQLQAIVDDSREHGLESISKALNLPTRSGSLFPRAEALEGIAVMNWSAAPSVASSALKELNKAVEDCPPLEQAKYLISEGQLLLMIGDKKAVSEDLKRAAEVAEALYKDDSNPEDPNRAMKAYWPSAVVWKRLLPIAMGISDSDAVSLVTNIHDPEMRMVEEVALANLCLGVPDSSSLMSIRKKSRTFTATFGSN